MTGELGYAMIDGIRVPVASASLTGGQVLFSCRVEGPIPASRPGSRPITIFGEDGIGICQGDTNASWPEVQAGEYLELPARMRWDRCYGDAEVPGGQGS